jgi:hypothetical protein
MTYRVLQDRHGGHKRAAAGVDSWRWVAACVACVKLQHCTQAVLRCRQHWWSLVTVSMFVPSMYIPGSSFSPFKALSSVVVCGSQGNTGWPQKHIPPCSALPNVTPFKVLQSLVTAIL